MEDTNGENSSPGRKMAAMNTQKASFALRPAKLVVPARDNRRPVIKYENLDASQGRPSQPSDKSQDDLQAAVSYW